MAMAAEMQRNLRNWARNNEAMLLVILAPDFIIPSAANIISARKNSVNSLYSLSKADLFASCSPVPGVVPGATAPGTGILLFSSFWAESCLAM
jgi:hypothetical protein